MNQAKRIAKYVMNVLCVLLFIILVLVIYAKLKITFTNNKVQANYFGYRILEIASGSMEPTLKKNDIILLLFPPEGNSFFVFSGKEQRNLSDRTC